MSDETRRVLDLLAQGKITVDEADQLLSALKAPQAKADADPPPPSDAGKPRYLRIQVHKTGGDGRRDKDVNIRVPMAVVRGGMRLGTLIPGFNERITTRLRERGVDIDFAKMDAAAIEALLKDLGQLNIDVNEGDEQVRITCE
jgi:hypothetical protein